MLGNMLTNMLCSLLVTHPLMMAERNITNIFIKVVLQRIAVVIRLVGAHRMLVPLAGKHALPANRFKTATNSANTSKKIDKAKSIMWMMRRRRR